MAQLAKEITKVTVEDELKQSYLDYAMSVIVGRALPDVRDGLKPVHRRVLFAMKELNNDWNKPYKKSARIVGDVIGKYHPHGDVPVYDTIVRMAQPFSLRCLMVDGQGNFGSVDGDSPAAMRYTEIRMTKMAHSLLVDLEKETVDYSPNYDGTELIPNVLPTRIPNLLVNGSSGIAVGMATNIPPHNLGETIDAALSLIDNPDQDVASLMQFISGPDFPTGAIINGRAGILQAYKTGRGKIYVRGRTEIEVNEKTKRVSIIVTELPYQVNKARLLEKIGELVRDKKIEGIVGLRDESDKQGMRAVIEVRRGDQPEVVLNNLYIQTQLQTVFGINMVALVNSQPRLITLPQALLAFVDHRREVVTRRTIFELRKARERAHILEGLGVALVNIDDVISLIKTSATPAEAKAGLLSQSWSIGVMAALLQQSGGSLTKPKDLDDKYGLQSDGYRLSPAQAQAILELKLHRLTGLEKDKISNEYNTLIGVINGLINILENPDELHRVIREELIEIKAQFNDDRRTEIVDTQEDLTAEDLITEENLVVTLSEQGYVKSQSLDSYQAQHRGGRGKSATSVKDQDFVRNVMIAHSHDTLLCFSTSGKVYWLRTYQIPQGGRQAKGRPIVNLLPLAEDETISAILSVSSFEDNAFVIMVTARGTIKKVKLAEFSRPRLSGKIALDIVDGDSLIGVNITDGEQDIMLISDAGKALRFAEKNVRVMGRQARGVRGMMLKPGQRIIAQIIVDDSSTLLTATVHGFGQRTEMTDYRATSRGRQGVMVIKVSNRNGPVVAATQVSPDNDILLISDQGTMVRTPVAEISVLGRNTQGVKLMNLSDQENLVGVEACELLDCSDEGASEGESTDGDEK